MTIASPFESPSACLINRLPYDILLEIFVQCLPQSMFHSRLQPDTTAAPLLLCRVCAAWRTAALTSAVLWAHFCLRLTVVQATDTPADPASWTSRFGARGVRWLRWWRTHQGAVPPFLRLDVYTPMYVWGINQDLAPPDSTALLLEYIASAQYLELDRFYWGLIEKKLMAGDQLVFPNLHTLLVDHQCLPCHPFYHVQSLLPNNAPPVLRRLSIIAESPPEAFAIPNHWSALTHVSLHILTSLHFWSSFIRAVPNLQWAHFDIVFLSSTKHTARPGCTLPQLTTLLVSCSGRLTPHLTFPLGLLFTALHLPVLRTLSLASPGTGAWEDSRALTGLHDILRSTPAITKLALADNFIAFHTRPIPLVLADIKHAAPLWTHTPQLVHLQLDLPSTKSGNNPVLDETLDVFVHNILSSESTWLDLRHPRCPVRSLSLSDHGSSAHVRDYAMASIWNISVEKAPNVVFQFTSDSAERAAAEMRNGWGSQI